MGVSEIEIRSARNLLKYVPLVHTHPIHLSKESPYIGGMSPRKPKYSAFSVEVDRRFVNWSPIEPFLTGDEDLIKEILNEIESDSGYMVTPTGPNIKREIKQAAPVYLAMLAIFGEKAQFKNPPDLTLLWVEPWMLDPEGLLRKDIIF